MSLCSSMQFPAMAQRSLSLSVLREVGSRKNWTRLELGGGRPLRSAQLFCEWKPPLLPLSPLLLRYFRSDVSRILAPQAFRISFPPPNSAILHLNGCLAQGFRISP